MVAGLALLLAIVPEAPSEEPRPASIDLRWRAPPGCSSAEAIQARIVALLSGPPRGDGEAIVEADVAKDGEAVRMTLTTTFAGASDVREVAAASCDALAEATAVLLAVALEPEPEPEREPTLEPGPVVEPPPTIPMATRSPEAEPVANQRETTSSTPQHPPVGCATLSSRIRGGARKKWAEWTRL